MIILNTSVGSCSVSSSRMNGRLRRDRWLLLAQSVRCLPTTKREALALSNSKRPLRYPHRAPSSQLGGVALRMFFSVLRFSRRVASKLFKSCRALSFFLLAASLSTLPPLSLIGSRTSPSSCCGRCHRLDLVFKQSQGFDRPLQHSLARCRSQKAGVGGW